MISLANLPEELRKGFKAKMKAPIEGVTVGEKEPQRAFRILQKAVDEKGEIHLLTMMKLAKIEHMKMSLEDLVSTAEAEGLITRLGEGHWAFLG